MEDGIDDAGPGRIIPSLYAKGLGRCAGRRGNYWQRLGSLRENVRSVIIL
jgi:hypothetical protein